MHTNTLIRARPGIEQDVFEGKRPLDLRRCVVLRAAAHTKCSEHRGTVFGAPIPESAVSLDRRSTLIVPRGVAVGAANRDALVARPAAHRRRRSSADTLVSWATPTLAVGAILLWSAVFAFLIGRRDGAQTPAASARIAASAPMTNSEANVAETPMSPPVVPAAPTAGADMSVRELVSLRRAEFRSAIDAGDALKIATAARRLAGSLEALPGDEQADDRERIANEGRHLAAVGQCQLAIELIDLGAPDVRGQGAREVRAYARCASPAPKPRAMPRRRPTGSMLQVD